MEDQIKPSSQSLIYGLIYGLLSSLVLYVSYKIGYTTGGITTLLGFVLAAVCVLLSVNLYKNSNSGQITIANALLIGLMIGLIGGVIYAIYVYLHYDIVDTTTIGEQLKIAEEQMKQQSPQMTEEQIDQAMKISALVSSPASLAILKFIGALFETFIVALVIGLIKKSD
jgi:chromate transport protein ChrA